MRMSFSFRKCLKSKSISVKTPQTRNLVEEEKANKTPKRKNNKTFRSGAIHRRVCCFSSCLLSFHAAFCYFPLHYRNGTTQSRFWLLFSVRRCCYDDKWSGGLSCSSRVEDSRGGFPSICLGWVNSSSTQTFQFPTRCCFFDNQKRIAENEIKFYAFRLGLLWWELMLFVYCSLLRVVLSPPCIIVPQFLREFSFCNARNPFREIEKERDRLRGGKGNIQQCVPCVCLRNAWVKVIVREKLRFANNEGREGECKKRGEILFQ